MEALHQGASAALVLVGLAALLFGIATLWRAAGQLRVQQQELAYERDLHEHAAQQRRERADRDRRRLDLVYALVPAATAALGHWLGSRSVPHGLGLPAPMPPCAGCIPRPTRPPTPPLFDEDDAHVELDLESLLEALSNSELGAWISSTMRAAKANRAADDDDATTFVNVPIVPPTSERPS